MRVARIAVLGIALGAGVAAAVLAFNLTSARPAATPAPAIEAEAVDTAEVLVASRDIPMGTTIAEDDLEWLAWPAATAASGRFLLRDAEPGAMETAVGAIARSAIYAGEPIAPAKLIRSDRGFMSAILPAGKRAVATTISAETSAGGFILPNDRVDVIMTRETGNPDSPTGFVTETILNDVKVLAIDQTIEDVDGERVVVGQTATLELTPQQAEILTVAQQMSDRLTLALRSIADAGAEPGRGDAVHLIGGATERGGVVTFVRHGVVSQVSSIR
jgi:pilus assembly protein CpaB